MTKPGWIDLNSFHLVTLIQILPKLHDGYAILAGTFSNFRLGSKLDDAASLNFITEMLRIWPYWVSIIFNEFQKEAGKSLIIHLRYSHKLYTNYSYFPTPSLADHHAKPGLIVVKWNRPVEISGVV